MVIIHALESKFWADQSRFRKRTRKEKSFYQEDKAEESKMNKDGYNYNNV